MNRGKDGKNVEQMNVELGNVEQIDVEGWIKHGLFNERKILNIQRSKLNNQGRRLLIKNECLIE